MEPGEVILNVVFYALAAVGVACAIAVCASKNIVRTAFALLGVLGAAAGLYLIAFSDFMMVIQVLVYIGGILVLIIFAIMLTHRIRDVNLSNESTHSLGAVAICGAMLTVLVLMITRTTWMPYEEYKRAQAVAAGYDESAVGAVMVEPKQTENLTKEIGLDLTHGYLLPFEAISVLLLAALVGAAFLARKEVRAP